LLIDEQTEDFLSAELSRAFSSAVGILYDTWVSVIVPSKCLGIHKIIHILPQFCEWKIVILNFISPPSMVSELTNSFMYHETSALMIACLPSHKCKFLSKKIQLARL